MSERAVESFRILEDIIFLKKVLLFSGVKTHDLKVIACIAREITFDRGEEIVREGDVGDSMYVIKEGSVSIVKSGGGAAVNLAELRAGDCFGDMAVFDAEVRSASVIASERCVLLQINGDDLIDVLLEYPHIAIQFIKTFVGRMRSTNAKIERISHERSGKA